MKNVKTNRGMLKYFLLSLITCGIYSLFFMKRLEEDVNAMCKGDGKVTMNYWLCFLLSLLTGGIWSIIWYYQVCDRVYTAGQRYNVQTSCTGSTYLLWSLVGALICVGPYVALYKSFKDMNAVGEAYNRSIRVGA